MSYAYWMLPNSLVDIALKFHTRDPDSIPGSKFHQLLKEFGIHSWKFFEYSNVNHAVKLSQSPIIITVINKMQELNQVEVYICNKKYQLG